MTVSAFSGVTEAATALSNGGAAQSSARVADDFQTFLGLLLTQLENQNPLEPLDTNQFTEQLVQFAEVEQQIAANENLELQMNLTAALVASSAVNFIGKSVTVETAQANLTNGSASWDYMMAGDPVSARFTIRDQNGGIVFSETKPINNPRGVYSWNGRGNDGEIMPDGNYTITVEPTDGEGNPLNATTASTVKIEGVDFAEAEPMLKVGGQLIPLSAVTSVDT